MCDILWNFLKIKGATFFDTKMRVLLGFAQGIIENDTKNSLCSFFSKSSFENLKHGKFFVHSKLIKKIKNEIRILKNIIFFKSKETN